MNTLQAVSLTMALCACLMPDVALAAPDGPLTSTIRSKRSWDVDIVVRDNLVRVLPNHGITPEAVSIREASDTRLRFEMQFSKANSCAKGSKLSLDLRFRNGVYKSGSASGNCIGYPPFQARVKAK